MNNAPTMIEGALDLFWENNDDPGATRRYRIGFVRYAGIQHGAQKSKRLVGEDSLLEYLIAIQASSMEAARREQRAKGWILELHDKRSLSLPNVQLNEQECESFRS